MTDGEKIIYNNGTDVETPIRCDGCNKLLAVSYGGIKDGYIVIRCPRCKREKIISNRAQ